ncbi:MULTISPECIES: carbonic anhydrase [Alteribacter]|uniref:carbonic anhydrase n=1 Tax=Alteribacter keqinensis TaxID=2483800 RepID=A0A3M7TPL4_9BACI|nr:carbonic anhydrase [Alteribacter keqinensis]MBM7095065.1 carbonate dehydratase [Alteribacter salitolerans]RNA67194.1 carbonate dehydratase [Alteribacter keqinensis]
MELKDLKRKNIEFQEKWLKDDPEFFERLNEGQHPEFLVLACSDSRVCPSTVMDAEPGHMFIHRNIANQVVHDDDSFGASLYYALVHLKVKYILIKGHTGCGGVQAAWNDNREEGLQNWLKHVKESLPTDRESREWTSEKLCKYNVLYQVTKLKEHPVYQEHGQGVPIIGALYNLASGELDVFDQDTLISAAGKKEEER